MSTFDSEYDHFYNDFVVDSEVLALLHKADSAPASSDVEDNAVDDVQPGSGDLPDPSAAPNSQVLRPGTGSVRSTSQDNASNLEDEFDCFPDLVLTQEDNALLDALEQRFFQSQSSATASSRHAAPVSVVPPQKHKVVVRSNAPHLNPQRASHQTILQGASSRVLPASSHIYGQRIPLTAHNSASGVVIVSSNKEVNRKPYVTNAPSGSSRKRSEPDSDVVENQRPTKDSVLDVNALTEQAAKKRRLDIAGVSMGAVSPSAYSSYLMNASKPQAVPSASASRSFTWNNTQTNLNLRPIDRFFAQFHDFEYKRNAPVNKEYARLGWHKGWKRDTDESNGMYQKFRSALVDEFNNTYGMDENDIGSWRYLCTLLGIDQVPDSLYECRQVVLSTHVNLVDLLDTHRTGQRVKIFDTEEELSEYTCETKKFFPLDSAKQGGVLKYLLRHIFDPEDEDQDEDEDEGDDGDEDDQEDDHGDDYEGNYEDDYEDDCDGNYEGNYGDDYEDDYEDNYEGNYEDDYEEDYENYY